MEHRDAQLVKPNIGIAGVGYVGGAVRHWFRKENYPLFFYDTYKEIGSIPELNSAEIIFLCLPTPFMGGGKGFDDSALFEVLSKIEGEKVIVVKSTVLPGTTERYQKEFPQHQFLMNPEFLVAKTALQDFLNPPRQIIGYTETSREIAQDILNLLPKAPFKKIVRATEAEMIKYFGNTFLSARVIFANHMYDVCEKLGIDYDVVKEAAGADERIGTSHFNVHHDGYRGYGGGCLPKDIRAFIQFVESIELEPKFLKVLEEINTELRNGNQG